MGAGGNLDADRLVEQVLGAVLPALEGGGVTEQHQAPVHQGRRALGAVPVGELGDERLAVRVVPAEYQRRADVHFDLLGQVVLAAPAQVGQRRWCTLGDRREVVVDARPHMVDQGMVRLAVAADQTLVPGPVLAHLVALTHPGESEDDERGVVRWRDGQDALGPVADLGAAAERDLRHNRTDECVRERPVAGGAGPVDRGVRLG